MTDAISRQSVIDMLDETKRIARQNIDGAVLMTFERVLDSLVNITNALPTVQAEPHWIPVTERLPKESGLYQVTDMQGNVVRYVFNANEGSVEYWRRCVKAWMTLPEPYKGVTT